MSPSRRRAEADLRDASARAALKSAEEMVKSAVRDVNRARRGLVRVTFWLPVELVAALDGIVGRRGRVGWLRRAMAEAIGGAR